MADNKYMHGEMPYKMMPKDAIEELLGLSDNDDDNDKVRKLRKPADSYFIWFLSRSISIHFSIWSICLFLLAVASPYRILHIGNAFVILKPQAIKKRELKNQ